MGAKASMPLCGLALFLLATQQVWAGPYEDGLAAHEHRDAPAPASWNWLAEREGAAGFYQVGLIYAEGHGVTRDDAAALKWFRRAASHRYPAAQFAIARFYEEGRGVRKSPSSAMKWYRYAGQQGHVAAQLILGQIYDEGRGVPQNDWQAEKWYRLAADNDDVTAQTNLGLLYSRGRGVARDTVQAHFWLSVAAASGDAKAAKMLGVIAAQMTRDELDRSQKLVTDWTFARAQSKAARCRTGNFASGSC